MSGVSLFLQDDAHFNYSKAEYSEFKAVPFKMRDAEFTHLVTARARVPGFRLIYAAEGFERLQLWPPALRLAPRIHVLERERI
mmetsp:Transcript_24914/g.57601  ORF Transcript_24914/g.57601 Transcript_24914/m.57601 type:complete len:83 (+) Transcript_24914:712-960(+)